MYTLNSESVHKMNYVSKNGKEKPHITVGILAWNEEKTIQTTLHSLLRQSLQPDEILVAANGCTDNTVAKVIEMQDLYPFIRLLEIEERGKPNAWNIVRAGARYETIAFADGDVAVHWKALEHLYKTLKQNIMEQKSFAAVGAQIIPYVEELDWISRLYWASWPYPPKYVQHFIYGGLHIMNGMLYMANNKRLTHHMEDCGFQQMPTDVINDDRWITLVLGEGNWCIESKAKVFFVPPSWIDIPKSRGRVYKGSQQLREKYPELWQASKPASRGTYPSSIIQRSILQRLCRKLKNFLTRPKKNLFERPLIMLASYIKPYEGDWGRIESSKVAIPPKVYLK